MKMAVSHILVDQKFEAEDLLRKLNEGASFEELARKHSKCPSAAQGGDLGVIDSRRLDEDFAEAAGLLKTGQISGTVRTRFGYHLILRKPLPGEAP
ncbi:MAG TPA: peptidylprolyl isomerase [Pseudobdellovibrionaceae bacterium]|nr:peptidylprolyl isomerase [Pseudobdellovibrionaceae bacterium]